MSLFLFFGADEIALSGMEGVMAGAPEIIVRAAPVMFFFVLVEMWVAHKSNHHYYDKKESLGSLAVGIGNVVISLLIKVSLFYGAVWLYNLIPWRMPLNGWLFIPCYIIFDLCSYWAHRISHQQRFWWATHIPHHTAEHFNLTVSFRLSWVQYIKIIFLFPIALLGFHPVLFFVTNQVAILFQFWVHTEYIRKLPRVIEFIFATPSNHRVHHGSQKKYIDKNYGATFIIWDRMFGTYQPEEEKAIYGITANIRNSANPLYINFHEFADIVKDVRSVKNWRTKLFYVFGSPSGVAEYKKRIADSVTASIDNLQGKTIIQYIRYEKLDHFRNTLYRDFRYIFVRGPACG